MSLLIENTRYLDIEDVLIKESFGDTDLGTKQLEKRITALENLASSKTQEISLAGDEDLTTSDLFLRSDEFTQLQAEIAGYTKQIAEYSAAIPTLVTNTLSNLATKATLQARWNQWNTRDPSGTLEWGGNYLLIRRLTPQEMEIRCIWTPVSGSPTAYITFYKWDNFNFPDWPDNWIRGIEYNSGGLTSSGDTGYIKIPRGQSQYGEGGLINLITHQTGSGEMQYTIYGKNTYTGRTAMIGTING